jgi:hypothetical protein
MLGSNSNLNQILQHSLSQEQKPKVQQEEQKYHFKTLTKLPQDLGYTTTSYPYQQTGLYFSIDSRPLETSSLEATLEQNLALRMKKFLPTNFDLVDYDKELFKKQLDLEKVEITLTRDHDRELEYELAPDMSYYVRSVVRSSNEEGMFSRLMQELCVIVKQYSVSDEEINKLFIEVCCSKTKLIEALAGKSFTKWNELEDMALSHGVESMEYVYLLKTKGAEEILRRKKFLGY